MFRQRLDSRSTVTAGGGVDPENALFFGEVFVYLFLCFRGSTGIQNDSKTILKCKKRIKTSLRNACVFFNVFGHVFYGFGDPQTLDFDDPSNGF